MALQFNIRSAGKLMPALAALMLAGCFGGTVAQQLARSIFVHGADKATAAMVDAHERTEKQAAKYRIPNNTEFDDYQIAFLRSGFELVQPQIEPLPQPAAQVEPAPQKLQASKLVNVEVWSLLIGDEKQKLLEKAQLQGSPLIPPREEWSQWYLAVGEAESAHSAHQHAITFLIPPGLGKMHSGGKALVEISAAGGLNIARYALN